MDSTLTLTPVTRTSAKWGKVTSYLIDVDGYRITGERIHGHGSEFRIYTYQALPDIKGMCGPSSRSHGSVKGGRGVGARILAAGRAAIASGAASHDQQGCRVCTPRVLFPTPTA